jgi:hypothetical protein
MQLDQGASRMTRKTAAQNTPDALLLDLARKHFFLETLETRKSDDLDFHNVGVWAIRAALEVAYKAGRDAGTATNAAAR